MSISLTVNDVKRIVEEKGYEFIDTYMDEKKVRNVVVKCKNGHQLERSCNAFKRLQQCPICSGKTTKKWRYENVKQSIESEGFKLLTEEYKTNSEHLEIQCPNGHIYKVTFANWVRGRRCATCSKKKKLTIEDVRNYVKENEPTYKVISDEYKNAKSHLEFECGEGHRFNMQWGNFQQGYRCIECSGNFSKYTEDYVRNYLKKNYNFELISQYRTSKNKIKIKCQHNHEFDATFDSIRKNMTKCPLCDPNPRREKVYERINEFFKDINFELIKIFEIENKIYVTVKCKNGHIHDATWNCFKYKKGCSDCQRHTESDVIKHIESEGYKIDMTDYIDSNSRVKITCPNNHTYNGAYDTFMKGRRCPYCTDSPITYTHEEVEDIFKQAGYELLSKFEKQMKKVKFKCDKGHFGEIRVYNFLTGVRCDECAKEQRRITMYENGNNIVFASRQQVYLNNLLNGELNYPCGKYLLDIAFPNEKITIEYQGGGHDLQVRLGKMSPEEFNKKENIRKGFLKKNKWKLIEIVCKKDKLPSDEIIKCVIEKSNAYLQNNDWILLDFDNNSIQTKTQVYNYDFGEVRKINNLELTS